MRSMSISAESRLGYRLQRIWLTPVLRALVRTGIPCLIVSALILNHISQPEVRTKLALSVLEFKSSIEDRPEFRVHLMAVEGASADVAELIRASLHLDFPTSSFDLDLEALRISVEALAPVKSASLRIRPGGTLEISVVERVPALVWRTPTGLSLLDVDGVQVRAVATRAARPDLPLVVGDGADSAVIEALDLIRASAPIADRLRGLRRVGERRWDVVLDRDQVIQLPETDSVRALERVILLDTAQELLGRDITHVDLRNSHRPTLRLAQSSLEELRLIRGLELGVQPE